MLKECRRTGESAADVFDNCRRQLMRNITWGLLPGMEKEFANIFEDYHVMTMLPYVMKPRMWKPDEPGCNEWYQLLDAAGKPLSDSPYS
jgi:hypothetical protein